MRNSLLPMNLQMFAADAGVSGAGGSATQAEPNQQQTQQVDTSTLGVDGLSQLLAQYQQTQQANTQGQQTQQQSVGAEPTQQQQVQQTQQQQTDPAQQQDPPPQPNPGEGAGNAWAQMRVQNKQMESMLHKIADAYDIKANSTEELIQKLNDDAITKLSAKQGVPKELLQRLEILEQHEAEYQKIQTDNYLTQAFVDLQKEFNLDSQALMTFANQLQTAGIDPYKTKVDIRAEYVSRNLDSIIQARINQAVEQALRIDQGAAQQSTTPLPANGPNSTQQVDNRINTTAGLQALLAGIK